MSEKKKYNYSRLSKTISYRLPNHLFYKRKSIANQHDLSVSKLSKLIDEHKIGKLKIYKLSADDLKWKRKQTDKLISKISDLSSQVSELETQWHGIGLNIDNLVHTYFIERQDGETPDYDNLINSLKTLLKQKKLDESEHFIEGRLDKLWQLLQ